MSWDWNWVLIIVGASLVLIEVAFGGFAGFDLVLIGSSFVLGGGIGLVVGNAPVGFVVASVLCVAYIAVGRRWVRRRLDGRSVHSNADALIGERGVVARRITEHEPGQIRIRNELWLAVSAPGAGPTFEPGAVVTVQDMDGITLRVR